MQVFRVEPFSLAQDQHAAQGRQPRGQVHDQPACEIKRTSFLIHPPGPQTQCATGA